MISSQEERNQRLRDEIAIIEKSIEEIDNLERQKERLLARMEIIDQLQKSRPEIVHLFDEMVRQLPEGVHLTGMQQTGSRVEVRGVAQSSTRVSALMRQIDSSEWLMDPEVERVETTTAGASRQAEFVVYLKQVRSDEDMMEDAE
jgi:type IV pilus assembly protein PilN